MFSEASVSHSVHRVGGRAWRVGRAWQAETAHCMQARYASYWNAFLSTDCFYRGRIQTPEGSFSCYGTAAVGTHAYWKV